MQKTKNDVGYHHIVSDSHREQTMKLPLVTIIITSYNYGRYIRKALESVKWQTYRPIECIIVDDASTDNSILLIQEFLEKNPNTDTLTFQLHKIQKNSGQLAAFELGLKKATGVFLNFLDADDILLPDFVNTHVQVLLNVNVGMSASEQIIIDETDMIVSLTEDDPKAKFKNIYPMESVLEFTNFQESLTLGHIQTEMPPVYTLNNQFLFGSWLWRPTSNIVFRRGILDLFNYSNEYETWRICADRLILNLVHYIAGSCHINQRLVAYRRHGMNSYSKRKIMGISTYTPNETRTLDGTKEKTAFSIFLLFKRRMTEKEGAYSDPAFFRKPVLRILPGLSPIFILSHITLWAKLIGTYYFLFLILFFFLPFQWILIRIKKTILLFTGKLT